MAADPALAVLATRIRIALMRHSHQSVDPHVMVEDSTYAQEVMALCRASHESALAELADQFESLLRKLGRALPGQPSSGPRSSRFDTEDDPPSPASNTPGTPPDPRNKRYLRGAR